MPGESPDAAERLTALEGRMIAHRRLLARLLLSLDAPARREERNWLADRALMSDGQEDPGAVLTGAEGLTASIADEFRQISDLTGDIPPR